MSSAVPQSMRREYEAFCSLWHAHIEDAFAWESKAYGYERGPHPRERCFAIRAAHCRLGRMCAGLVMQLQGDTEEVAKLARDVRTVGATDAQG